MLSFFILALSSAYANSMLKEMSNAVEIGAGTNAERDAQVEFSLHFGSEKPVVVTGADYDSFKLFSSEEGLPTSLELYAGSGDEKHNILINISAARYYRLNVEKRNKDWHYEFEFYF